MSVHRDNAKEGSGVGLWDNAIPLLTLWSLPTNLKTGTWKCFARWSREEYCFTESSETQLEVGEIACQIWSPPQRQKAIPARAFEPGEVKCVQCAGLHTSLGRIKGKMAIPSWQRHLQTSLSYAKYHGFPSFIHGASERAVCIRSTTHASERPLASKVVFPLVTYCWNLG